ncbi:hypothetical protein T440DRAFT_521805 [Plenodomus tracheiphilus IPT5]|uniref:Glycosyltransferase family 34 protein n=1 Tax=Plenodomus tracheiphilus IPT5 TaxID=1408161 RepID=A0A6A7ATQ7_9PLEO|nr:hypothetical protein T440DRAFT_521805 [Plenodomus tracheiphilus IPT5]
MLVEPRLFSIAQRYAVFAVLILVVWSVYSFRPSDVTIFSERRMSASNSTSKTATVDAVHTSHTASQPTATNVLPYQPCQPLHQPGDPLRDAISTLFSSIRIDATQRHYRDADGKYFTGAHGNNSVWKEPLGRKVVIVDVDTRVPTGDNQILNAEKKINWGKLESGGTGLISHAITSHYLYAMIHGYDYKYYQAASMPGHHDTWIKPHLIKDMLPDYQFVITMDADAVVAHPEIPLEWLFNRWGIAEHTSIAMPHDTEEYINGIPNTEDSNGVPVLNSGFIVTQNNELTFEMLEAWGNCTTEVRYPGCGHWKENWSHEQRAFSEYIRYDFDRTPQTIIGIPCDDGMGYPGFHEQAGPNFDTADCKGNFIRHYTLGKGTVHSAATETIAQVLVEVLQKSLLQHGDEVWKQEVKPVFHETEADEQDDGEGNAEEEEEQEEQEEVNDQSNVDEEREGEADEENEGKVKLHVDTNPAPENGDDSPLMLSGLVLDD